VRTRTKPPTETEIATNKQLRLLCQQLETIAATVTGSETADSVPDQLPVRIVDAITALQADRADLMAIRQTPFKWHHQPYRWQWMLHRYQYTYVGR
jgi:hypothetical protein